MPPASAKAILNPRSWSPRGRRVDAESFRHPVTRDAAVRLCDAVAAWLRNQASPPHPDLLRLLLDRSSVSTGLLAMDAVNAIAHKAPNADAILLDLMSRCRAPGRHALVVFLDESLPPTLRHAVITVALKDRSAAVRDWATTATARLPLSPTAPPP